MLPSPLPLTLPLSILSFPPSAPPSSHRTSYPLFPLLCTFSIAIPHRARGAHRRRCALSRGSRARTFTQPRIEHRLRSLVEFNDLSDHSVSLYLGLVDPCSLPLPLSLVHAHITPTARTHSEWQEPPLTSPLITADTSYLVLSLPASRPFLLSSFPPFLPPMDSSCFCTLPRSFPYRSFPRPSLLSVVPLFLPMSVSPSSFPAPTTT